MKVLQMLLGMIVVTFCSVFYPAFAATKTTDGEIVAYMEAINQHEIDVAKVALTKTLTPQVKSYADMMIDQHGKNLSDVMDLSKTENIPADETAAVKQFKENGDKDLKTLSALDGTQFQDAYITAMIKGHTKVDSMLTKFIDEANNANLKKYLTATKVTVEMHLQKAKELKQSK